MNEFQETILDTLMVADRIGERWKPGPLPLALTALKNAGLTRRNEPGPALGFPPLLCAAVEGAATTIRNVDDCRTLAIALFSEVPPRKKIPKLTRQQLVAAALWSVRRVPSFHAPEGPAHAEVADLLEEYLATHPSAEQTVQRLDNALDRAISAIDGSRADYVPHRLSLSAFYFALHTLRRAQNEDGTAGDPDHVENICRTNVRRAPKESDVEGNACLVTRDVARLAGLTHGVAAATPYCIELARRIGM